MPSGKTKRSLISNKKLTFILGGILLLVFLGFQVLIDVYVVKNVVLDGDSSVIINLISSAVDGLHKPAPLDPVTGKVYMPDVKLMLPASSGISRVEYYHSGEGTSEEINITTFNLINAAKSKLWSAKQTNRLNVFRSSGEEFYKVFAEVPNLQACARGVHLSYSPQTGFGPELVPQGTKILANGRTVYFYTETTCKSDLNDLVDYLKQIQSY